jgi:hypothetical protein
MSPIQVPDKHLQVLGFSDDDVKDLSEVGRFLETCETMGMNTTFHGMIYTLGRSKELVLKYKGILDRIRSRVELPKREEKTGA